MSLLDIIRGIPERMGRGQERNIGGLLGIDPEDMTEEERQQARRLSQMAVFDAMARGTSPIAGLREAAALLGSQREARQERAEREQRMGAAQQASSQIAGRLMGGMPLPNAPGPVAGDELTGVNVQSAYRRDPEDALRMSLSQAGMDAMQLSPQLAEALKQNVGQQVVGDTIYNRATGEFTRAPREAGPRLPIREVRRGDVVDVYFNDGTMETRRIGATSAAGGGFRLLSPEEVAKENLPKGTVAQKNLTTNEIKLLSQVPQTERVKLERGARVVARVEQGIENLTKHLDKVTTGGVMGLSGAISRVFDSQDAQQFNSFKEQLSSALRAALRIPGEGALSDFEQRQYGLTLPSLGLSKDRNLQIMTALADQVRLDSDMPTIEETRPPDVDPQDWFRMLPSERAAYLRAGAEQ